MAEIYQFNYDANGNYVPQYAINSGVQPVKTDVYDSTYQSGKGDYNAGAGKLQALNAGTPTYTATDGRTYIGTDGSGSDIAARLARAQWDDYKRRFSGIEDALMNKTSYQNPGIVGESVSGAVNATNKVFDTMNKVQGMQMSGYGAALNPTQQRIQQRSMNISRGAATVDAANRTRQRIADRDQQIAAGGLPGAGAKTLTGGGY